jgi:hypothetical protein
MKALVKSDSTERVVVISAEEELVNPAVADPAL